MSQAAIRMLARYPGREFSTSKALKCLFVWTPVAVWRRESHQRSVRNIVLTCRETGDTKYCVDQRRRRFPGCVLPRCLHNATLTSAESSGWRGENSEGFCTGAKQWSSSILSQNLTIRQWEAQLQMILSWDDVRNLQITIGKTLPPEEYWKVLEACGRRLWELHVRGSLSLTGLLQVVRDQCGDWQTLWLAVGCGAQLVEHGFFSFGEMSDFLYHVSTWPKRKRARCERLQCIVDILEGNLTTVSSWHLLRGLFGASRIPKLRVSPLMNSVDKLYCERLHKLSAGEVGYLLLASSRISRNCEGYSGRHLCLRFLVEHSDCLRNLPTSHCANLLSQLTFAFHKDLQLRRLLLNVSQDLEKKFAKWVKVGAGDLISRLCTCFSQLRFKSSLIPFQDCLTRQPSSSALSFRSVVEIFHYVAKHNIVEAQLLRCLSPWLSEIHQWSAQDITLFLTSLTLEGVQRSGITNEVARVVQKEVRCRLHYPQPFALGEYTNLFYRFVFLNLDSSPVVGMLFEQILQNFRSLSLPQLCMFLQGVAFWKKKPSYVAAVQDALKDRQISCSMLSVRICSSLCKAFLHMQIVDDVWLKEIAETCRRNVSLLLTNKSMRIAVHSLSVLCFRCDELFQDIRSWLDEKASAGGFSLVDTDTLVTVLWACVVQDVFPERALRWLSTLGPSSVMKLPEGCLGDLVSLNLLWRERSGKVLLQYDMHAALLAQIKNSQECLPRHVERCMQVLTALFPRGHLWRDVITAEGCRAHGVILKNLHGESAEWPDGVPEQPSVVDIQSVVGCGYQPVVIFVFGPRYFNHDRNTMLGHVEMLCRALNSCGWSVLVISTLDFKAAVDKERFLYAQLRKVDVEATKAVW